MAVYTHTTESESIFQIQTPSLAIESGTFSYNFLSADVLIVYDFGSILDTVIEEEDYQNNSLNEAVDSYEDYGYVSGEPTKIYGLFNFTGTPIVGFNLTAFIGITFALQGGSLAAFGQPYIGYGSIKCNGSANEAFVPKTEIGSGTLYNFVSKEERATFSYNQSSIVIKSVDDYGFIIDSYQDIDDFGIITKLVNRPDSEDYGNISTNDLRPYGNITFSGNASRSVNFILTANPEGGSLFSFTGSGEAFVPQISPKEGVFKIFGGLDRESFIPYIPPGSGSISKFVTKEERRTFSYNISSQNILTDEDFGYISEASPSISSYANTPISDLANVIVSTLTVSGNISQDDYGTISEFVNRNDSEDYGLITGGDDKPFGFFGFSGNASRSVNFILTANPEGGSLFGIGGGADALAKVYPVTSEYPEIINVTAEDIASDSNSVLQNTTLYQGGSGTGSVGGFNIGSHIRFGTFGQDGSRFVKFYLDLRNVQEITVSAIKGNGNNGGDEPESNENLRIQFVGVTNGPTDPIVVNENDSSFDTLNDSTISVPVGARNKNQEILLYQEGNSGNEFDHYGFKSLRYASIRLPEIKNLFTITGSSTESIVPATHIGSGTLFNFITKEERRTFSYNGSSVVTREDENFGSIGDVFTDSDDYGSIGEVVNRPDSEDYGYVSTILGRPYGSLRFQGNASKDVRFRIRIIGSGSLFALGDSSESTLVSPKAALLFNVSGAATERITPATHIGSGTLFNFITKEERRTFSYNGSQQTNSFKIFGDNSKTSRIRLVYIGSGSLFTFGGGNESITPFIPERFTLFKVVGSSTESITPATHIGSGTLFNFITKEERRTFSYNGSSVVIRNDDDYGFISNIAVTPSPSISSYANTPISTLANQTVSTFGVVGNQDDYGSIGEVVNRPDSEDYGFITSTQERRPFGRLIFSGGLIEQFTPKYFGSGTLFAFNNALVSKSPIHVGSGSFNITGSATLSALTPEIGSGVLFTFVSADESKTFRHISDESTGLRISGEVSDLASTADEVGTGRLFAATGAAETFGANPFLPPALFKFKSGSTESFTPATHVVTGVVSPRRASAIFDPEEKIRLVGATESTTNSPDIPASGFSIKAPPVRIFFQYREQGGGKLTLAGNARIRLNPRHRGSGKFNINGIGKEATVPFIPPGSGSLFSFVNGDESTTPATHIGQGKLFSLRGTAETQFPRGFVGGGQIRVNVETGIIVIWDYPVNLTIPVRGESDNAIVRDYIGTGKFTISDESDNYFANRFFSFSGGFSILGKAKVVAPVSYSGSGTLFAFDSSAENTGANPPDRTLPIRLVGTANESKTEIFNGSGFITSAEKRAERVLRYTGLTSPQISEYANTPISDLSDEIISEFLQEGLLEEYALASANESFVSVPPTEDSAITIEGSRENETQSSDYVGSGSLFSFDSATESTLYSPIGEITLFEFEGNLEESRAFSYSEKTQGLFGKDTNLPKPFGKQFVFGTASVVSVSSETGKDKAFKFDGGITSETFAPANKAEGGLFGFNSSTESVLYSPIGEITLFEFEGNSDEKISLVTIGSGSLFGFVNGAESSLVEPPVETLLLNITGSATERITPGPHSGSGTIFSFIGSAESTTSAEDKKVLFKINVDSSEKRTSTFEGLGKITSLGSSTKVIVFKYPPTEGILQIFGNKIESFGKANYDGECRTQFIGISSNKTVEFEPPKPIRLYLI